MASVVSLIQMTQFEGRKKAVFPEGTIITPAALDWAKENSVEISFGDSQCNLLSEVVGTIVEQYKKDGIKLEKELLVETTEKCLKKLGCLKD